MFSGHRNSLNKQMVIGIDRTQAQTAARVRPRGTLDAQPQTEGIAPERSCPGPRESWQILHTQVFAWVLNTLIYRRVVKR